MANIKEVYIAGEIPFHVSEHHDLNKFLGQLNGPTIGLRIDYTGLAPSRPNEHGGQTAYYKFCISGQEAVSSAWLEKLLQALVNAGAGIEDLSAVDIENNERIKLKVPTKQTGEFVCELRIKVRDKKLDEFGVRRLLEQSLSFNHDEKLVVVANIPSLDRA